MGRRARPALSEWAAPHPQKRPAEVLTSLAEFLSTLKGSSRYLHTPSFRSGKLWVPGPGTVLAAGDEMTSDGTSPRPEQQTLRALGCAPTMCPASYYVPGPPPAAPASVFQGDSVLSSGPRRSHSALPGKRIRQIENRHLTRGQSPAGAGMTVKSWYVSPRG